MEMSRCCLVNSPRNSASTPATWSGFTARIRTFGKFRDLGVGGDGFRAGFLGEMFPRGSPTGSPAMISLGKTISARTKPLASAVAILPAPRKPMFNVVAMNVL